MNLLINILKSVEVGSRVLSRFLGCLYFDTLGSDVRLWSPPTPAAVPTTQGPGSPTLALRMVIVRRVEL